MKQKAEKKRMFDLIQICQKSKLYQYATSKYRFLENQEDYKRRFLLAIHQARYFYTI